MADDFLESFIDLMSDLRIDVKKTTTSVKRFVKKTEKISETIDEPSETIDEPSETIDEPSETTDEMLTDSDVFDFYKRLGDNELLRMPEVKVLKKYKPDTNMPDIWSDVKFTHSKYGFYKGSEIEIYEIEPEKILVEFEVNEERMSSLNLRPGDRISNNCTVVSKIRDGVYSCNCTYSDTFRDKDVELDISNRVLIKRRDLDGVFGKIVDESNRSSIRISFDINEIKRFDKRLNVGDREGNCIILSEIENGVYNCRCSYMDSFKESDFKRLVQIHRRDLVGKYGIILSRDDKKIVGKVQGNIIRVDEVNVFYKDILLKNNRYFEVTHVETNGLENAIYGFRENSKIEEELNVDDIKNMNTGFKLHLDHYDELKRGDEYDTLEISDTSGYVEEPLDLDLDESTDNFVENMKVTFRDIERSAVLKSLLPSDKIILNTIEKIIKIIGIKIDNIYDILNVIKSKKYNNKLLGGKLKFTSFDTTMIIVCVVYYVRLRDKLNFDLYTSKLYDGGFFSKFVNSLSIIEDYCVGLSRLEKPRGDKFKGDDFEIYKKERIMLLLECFSVLLELRMSDDAILSVSKMTKGEDKLNIRSDKILRGYLISESDLGKQILWSKEELNRIEEWVELLKKKTNNMGDMTIEIYKYVINNIKNSPIVLYDLREKVILFLKWYSDDFSNKFNNCKDNLECEDLIRKYLENILDDVLGKGKGKSLTEEEYILLQRYKCMNNIVSLFLDDMKRGE